MDKITLVAMEDTKADLKVSTDLKPGEEYDNINLNAKKKPINECDLSIPESTENFNIIDSDQTDPNINKNIVLRYLKKKTEGLSQRQVIIIIVFAFVEFFAATVISIQASFFPFVAQVKGATSIEFGFVYAIFEIIVFIMSPIFGAMMGTIGPTKLLNYGIFTCGICCIIFGFLNHIEGRTSFIVMCLIVRGIEAVGNTAFVIASLTVIALEFPGSVATTFATIGSMGTFYGLGLIHGPSLGGALYEAGGYTLSFSVVGGLLSVSAVATFYLLPEIGQPKRSTQEDGKALVTVSVFEMFRMLRIPVISMIAYSIVITAGCVGYLSASLEPHLRQFDLNKFKIGMVFTLNGGVYVLTAPCWGRVCDKSSQPKYITLIGSGLTIGGFILLGQLPFLPLETSLYPICFGLVLFGLGLGATMVSAFIQALQDSIARGYPDDVSTYGLVSGLWTSMTVLGFYIGSSMGGILLHLVGFAWGTTFMIAGQLILVGCLMVYFYTQGKKKSSSEELEVSVVSTKPELDDSTTPSNKNSTESPTKS